MIDLTEAVQYGIQTAGLVLLGATGLFIRRERLRRLIDSVIRLGIDYAIESVALADWTRVETRNALVQMAVSYVLKSIPDTLKVFRITPERLADMVLARLLDRDKAPGEWRTDTKAPVAGVLTGSPIRP